ncbi:MAG: PAS domain S-box protein, partial [Proteobacteria bacterium]
ASAQDAVATEAIKLALITNVLPAFISYVDREERYQFVNDAYEEWFKVKREDTIGKNTLETQGRETYDNVNKFLKRALDGEHVHFETTLRREGRTRDIVVDYIPHRNAQGEVIGAINMAFDISDRRRAEQALKTSEERLQLALDASEIGFWDWDMVSGRVQMSETMLESWGLPASYAQTPFLSANAFIHPDDRQRLSDVIAHSSTTGEPYDIEHRVVRPDGKEIWVHGKGQILFNKAGVAVRLTGTSIDITERKRFEIELQRAKNAAEAANEAKTSFLANMSHEIRTPLAAISGFSDLLQDVVPDDSTARDYIQRIVTNAGQLRGLIDELLDLSKIEANRFELEKIPVDLKTLMAEAFSTISLKARE